jgi:hypothetical protein
MPKKGAAPAAPPDEPATETVQTKTDAKPNTATNPTTGGKATKPKPTPKTSSQLSGTLSDEEDYFSILYWGPYGTGKTINVLSMAKLVPAGRVLLINAEAGGKARAVKQFGIDPDQIVPWPPRGQELTLAGLERVFYEVAGDLQRDPRSWLGGVWDSVTEIHDTLLEQVVATDVAKHQAILDAAGTKRSGNIEARDPYDYEADDYQVMQAQFKGAWRKFRYLPWHFACTALVRRDEDKKTKKVTYGPAVSPKLQNVIGGGPDIVIRTITVETPQGPVWYGRTYATTDEPAKDRFGMLPRELVNPTFDRVAAYVRGELTEDDDPDQKLLPGGAEGKAPARPARSGKTTTRPKATDPAAEAEAKQEVVGNAAKTPRGTARSRSKATTPKPSELGDDQDPPF